MVCQNNFSSRYKTVIEFGQKVFFNKWKKINLRKILFYKRKKKVGKSGGEGSILQFQDQFVGFIFLFF